MRRLGLRAYLVVVLPFVACAGAPQLASNSPSAVSAGSANTTVPRAFSLPAPALAAAPWLDAPLAPVRPCELDDFQNSFNDSAFDRPPYVDDTLWERSVVSANVDTAIVRTRRLVLAVSRTRGVLGSLSLPNKTTWVGLSGHNRIFAATADGTLYRADATSPFMFEQQVNIPGATRWDSGGSEVAVLANGALMRSVDEGASFVQVAVPDADVRELAIRFDGVVVVQGNHRATGLSDAWLASDGGAFQRSTFALSSLFRWGGIIGSSDECGTELAADGRTWIHNPSALHWRNGLSDWPTQALETSSRLNVLDNPPSLIERPRQPGQDAPVLRANRGRTCTGHHATHAPAVKLASPATPGPHGAGASAISGRLDRDPPPYNTSLVWLSDGLVEHGTISRVSQLALLSRHPASLGAVQAPCAPARVFSTGGIGLVVCATNTVEASIFTIDREGHAFAEGALRVRSLDDLSLASAQDGTLLLRSQWGAAERGAFVRSPLALGSAGAWRSIPLEDAVEVRVADGGALLLITTGHVPLPATFSLTLARPGERRELFHGIPVDGSLLDLHVNRDKLVARTKPFGSHTARCQTLTASGLLE